MIHEKEDILFPIELASDPAANEPVESDEVRQNRLRKEIEDCLCGSDLFIHIRKFATQKRPKNRGKAVVFKKKSKRRFHISLVWVLKEPF